MNRALILAAAALSLAATVHAEAPAFDVLSYDVRLTPNFETQTVSGQTIIRFKSEQIGLDVLSFSANALDVTASLDGEAMVASEVQDGRRLFHLPYPIDKGKTARLTVTFKGKAPKGLVWGEYHVYANYFTCDYMICDQDRPGDKARVRFHVQLVNTNHVTSDGAYTSPYLMGFAAGAFDKFTFAAAGRDFRVFTKEAPVRDVGPMFSDTFQMIEFFERKSGVRLRKTYTQVVVPGDEAQEAANHSIIGLDNIAPILKDPHEDWVIAHELSHQWWGNAVTCADWSELWLNEGLAVFMTAAWKEHRWGRADYDRELALANKRWEAAKQKGFDVPLSWQGKYPSLGLKRAMAYAKAVVFLDTLRRELGEDAFWRGIKLYTRANWDKTVHAQDLQRAFERSAKRDLTQLFRTWVYG